MTLPRLRWIGPLLGFIVGCSSASQGGAPPGPDYYCGNVCATRAAGPCEGMTPADTCSSACLAELSGLTPPCMECVAEYSGLVGQECTCGSGTAPSCSDCTWTGGTQSCTDGIGSCTPSSSCTGSFTIVAATAPLCRQACGAPEAGTD